MAGYSGTPLEKKLGFKPGYTVRFINEPKTFRALLELPDTVTISNTKKTDLDLVVFFTSSQSELAKRFPALPAMIKKTGMIWISWPKKTSKLAGDLNENIVRELGLSAGVVDVKVCAIDEDWSGLKFVYRLTDR